MATTDQQPAASPSKSPRGLFSAGPARRLATGVVLALALFNLLGFYGVPLLLRHVAVPKLGAALARPVTVGDVSFNPNTLDLRIEDLHIGERAGEEGFVDVGRLAVNASWASLFKLSPVVESLAIESPQVRIVRLDAQRFNFSDLVPAAPADAPAEAESAPLAFQLGAVEISDGSVLFVDRSGAQEATLRLAPLRVHAQDVDSGRMPWPIEVSTALDGAGTLALSGTVTPEPLDLALRVNSAALDLAKLEPFFGARLNASVARAELDADGALRIAGSGDALTASYRGDAALNAVQLLDKLSGDRFAGWKQLRATGIVVEHAGGRSDVQIDALDLADFDARVILDRRGKLNLSHVVRPEGAQDRSLTRPEAREDAAQAEQESPGADSALSLKLGHIAFAGGHVNYTDHYIQPNFSADLSRITGTVGAIATQASAPAPVELNATLNDDDPVAIRGSVNPLAQPAFLDLRVDADKVVLNRVSPYSTKYLGYPIVQGTLTVDLHYRLAQEQLTATNHVVLDQLTFGDHVPGPSAVNLPVRLAIALLKDAQGRIDVSVPVSGSLSDPQFSVGRLVWSAFLNLIRKAATSPFTLLAGAVGGAEDLSYVEFAPGAADLDTTAQSRLATLAKALVERPEVEIELVAHVDAARDEPALREAYVERAVKRQKLADQGGASLDTVVVAPEEYEKYLEQVYDDADFDKDRNALGLAEEKPVDEMRRLLAAHAPAAETDLAALAQRRAEVVQRWLAERIAASRVHVAAPAPDRAAASRVEFTLKP